MNFVAVAIVSAIVLGHPFKKRVESSFNWFKLHSLCLNNSSQIAKYLHVRSGSQQAQLNQLPLP